MHNYYVVTVLVLSCGFIYAEDSTPRRATDSAGTIPGLAPFSSNAIAPGIAPGTPVYTVDAPDGQRFAWRNALDQSFRFLSLQHSVRLSQRKTRREFGGPFFNDWSKSIGGVNGWSDGDSVFTNYVGHPMQGAVSGYFQIHNDPKGKYLEFENSPTYWKSRLKAMAWSAAYSTQFEIGPLSEATIGNVGMRAGTSGYVDFVVTPTWGLGFIVAEDIVEKFLIRKLEDGPAGSNRLRVYRTLLTPQKAFANVLRGKWPWYRDGRPVPERP